MSKSQIKRLHQQQEAEKTNLDSENEQEPVIAQRKGPANRFVFFDEDGSDNNENNQQSDQDPAPSDDDQPAASEQKKKKKAKKANKKKGKKGDEEAEETENQMLARLAAANLKEAKRSGGSENNQSVESLMKIEMKHFDMNAELKRKLGSVFREALGSGEPDEDHRWPPGRRAKGRIVKNRPTWFPEKDYGLSMVQVKEEKGETWFKIKHNNYYEQRERMYWLSETHMNPVLIHEILGEVPYQLNCLLTMAHMSRMNEEFNTGAEWIERGIFYVDQYSAPTFEPFNWRHRMDYTDYENRAFYLLLHRHMLNAVHKRCWETALNTAKLIFKLDPVRDPLAIMSIIDSLAIKAKQYTWVVQMYEAGKRFKQLHLLPNWPYSVALAKFYLAKNAEDKEAADVELRTAIRHFPSVVVTLMDMLQIHPDSQVMNCKMFTTFVADNERESLKVLMKIYAQFTKDVWSTPDVMLFLERATRDMATSQDPKEKEECDEWRNKRNKMYHGRSPNVDRLGMLLEIIPCTSLSDPVPPANTRCGYAKDGRVIPEENGGNADSFLGAFVHSLVPYYDSRETLVQQLERNSEELLNILQENMNNARNRMGNMGDLVRRWIEVTGDNDGQENAENAIPRVVHLEEDGQEVIVLEDQAPADDHERAEPRED